MKQRLVLIYLFSLIILISHVRIKLSSQLKQLTGISTDLSLHDKSRKGMKRLATWCLTEKTKNRAMLDKLKVFENVETFD
jgi:hypothetical protein